MPIRTIALKLLEIVPYKFQPNLAEYATIETRDHKRLNIILYGAENLSANTLIIDTPIGEIEIKVNECFVCRIDMVNIYVGDSDAKQININDIEFIKNLGSV